MFPFKGSSSSNNTNRSVHALITPIKISEFMQSPGPVPNRTFLLRLRYSFVGNFNVTLQRRCCKKFIRGFQLSRTMNFSLRYLCRTRWMLLYHVQRLESLSRNNERKIYISSFDKLSPPIMFLIQSSQICKKCELQDVK